MGGAASVDCTSNSNYRYGETPEVQASDDTSWIGTKLDMPLKPFSVENYFELLDIVGTGMLGKVRLVRHRRSSLYYILKSVKKKDVIVKRMIPQLEAERDAMAQMTAIRHPFSVQFFGSLATSSHVHFLLDGSVRVTWRAGRTPAFLLARKHLATRRQNRFSPSRHNFICSSTSHFNSSISRPICSMVAPQHTVWLAACIQALPGAVCRSSGRSANSQFHYGSSRRAAKNKRELPNSHLAKSLRFLGSVQFVA
ncbi:hypothetical protein PC122_g13474 [Phytophthora cactorum]|nr:hypothetical protein PC122_g13474 [Phytophthora cactorum]